MKHLQGFHGNERVSFPCFLNINRLSPRATFKCTLPSLQRVPSPSSVYLPSTVSIRCFIHD